MANPVSNRSSRAVLFQFVTKLLAALPTALPNAMFVVNGESMTTAQVTTLLQSVLTGMAAAEQLNEQYHASVASQRVVEKEGRAAITAIEKAAAATLGTSSVLYAAL